MVTVKFKNVDLTTAATGTTRMVISAVSRPIRKPMTRRKLAIPGRAGSYDFGVGVAQDYTITVSGHITGTTSANVQTALASLSALLAGKEDLVISDQPAVTHTAQVYDEIRISPRPGMSRAVDFAITFECDA